MGIRLFVRLGGVVAAALLLANTPSASAARSGSCGSLGRLSFDRTKLMASEVAAGSPLPTSAAFQEARVAAKPFCRVQGVVGGTTRFEVWLPEPGAWNGRLQGLGVGGMAGGEPYPAMADAVDAGFAAVGSDLGHQSGFLDADWAIGHPEKVIEWGYAAVHDMTVRAKRVIAAYYGRPPRWSYFVGCSGGGREGMMEAQRYPTDYNGVLAGDPTIDFTRLALGGRLWGQLAMARAPGGDGYIPAAKLTAIAAAVVAACDPIDGVRDGVLEDPRACHFDPGVLKCSGADRDDCLTGPQVAALRSIYRGAIDSHGRRIYPGYEPGGELGPGGWAMYVSGQGPRKSTQWAYAAAFLKGMAFEDRAYDPLTFDFDRDVARIDAKPVGGETLASAINAANPDLSGFRRAGGRLIHYHGWSDIGVAPRRSIQYYESVLARSHGSRSQRLAQTQGFYRLFMAPGMQHCSGGPGPTSFDGLGPLQAWVEHGVAPERIVAARKDDRGRVVRTQPLCPYPARAIWQGVGNGARSEDFECRVPAGLK